MSAFAARLRGLIESATPGPWRVVKLPVNFAIKDSEGRYVLESSYRRSTAADSDLIVSLVNAAPRVADLVEAVEAYDESLRSGLSTATCNANRKAMFAALAALEAK